MSDSIISVENLSKRYIIGRRQRSKHDGLRHVIEEALHAPFRWLRSRREQQKWEREEFWALKDVSFNVKQGEVVGIIGRNGAGKSTLLKILSRITEPTEGRVRLKGRVASLLEVGTGFHPELTGRENIFLNGAILGMVRAEIKSKFDEIVAFSEIEKFLDTPVKHYSSGMYVRLAFAIAAHLEPEILIVDEVLAVGDVEFQRKCLGKMKEVSREGRRTVLFVSHNMAAVTSLTTRGILLLRGRVARDGTPDEVITDYLDSGGVNNSSPTLTGKGEHTRVISVKLLDRSGTPTAYYRPGQPMFLNVMFSTDGTKGLSLEFILVDANFNKVAFASLHQFHGVMLPAEAGTYSCCLQLGPMWLASGAYGIDVSTSLINRRRDHYVERAVTFHVPFSNPTGLGWDFKFSHGFGAFAWLVNGEPRFERVSAHEGFPSQAITPSTDGCLRTILPK